MPRSLKLLRWVAAALGVAGASFAYNAGPEKWGGTTVTMQLQLGENAGTLIDGKTSWNAVAEEALGIWNANMTNLKFSVVRPSTAGASDTNNLNNVFFSSSVYGSAWDGRTVGICLTRYNANNRIIEADVLFN